MVMCIVNKQLEQEQLGCAEQDDDLAVWMHLAQCDFAAALLWFQKRKAKKLKKD